MLDNMTTNRLRTNAKGKKLKAAKRVMKDAKKLAKKASGEGVKVENPRKRFAALAKKLK